MRALLYTDDSVRGSQDLHKICVSLSPPFIRDIVAQLQYRNTPSPPNEINRKMKLSSLLIAVVSVQLASGQSMPKAEKMSFPIIADAKAQKVSKATKLFKEKAPKADKMSVPLGKASKAESIKEPKAEKMSLPEAISMPSAFGKTHKLSMPKAEKMSLPKEVKMSMPKAEKIVDAKAEKMSLPSAKATKTTKVFKTKAAKALSFSL